MLSQVLTCDACPVTEVEGIPDHGPIGDGKKSLGVLVRICRVRGQRRPRPTENKGLQPRRGRGNGVRHSGVTRVAGGRKSLWRENEVVHVLGCFSVTVCRLACLDWVDKKIRVVCRGGDCSQSHKRWLADSLMKFNL